MIGAQIICRRRYDGIGPNGLAFSYYVLIGEFFFRVFLTTALNGSETLSIPVEQ